MAATKSLIPYLRLAVKRAGRTAVTRASSPITSQNFATSAGLPFEPLPELLLPFLRERPTHLSYNKSRKSSRLSTSTSQSKRRFSASHISKAVVVTSNPRKDEEGNDMLVDITSRAATVGTLTAFFEKPPVLINHKRLQEIMWKDSNPKLALRVRVESGGCHGFQYLMSLTNTSVISPEDDTVFEATDGSGAKVVMDEPSLELLKGSKIDYTMELIGSQFKIVGNPAATSSCGCGTSFDIKA